MSPRVGSMYAFRPRFLCARGGFAVGSEPIWTLRSLLGGSTSEQPVGCGQVGTHAFRGSSRPDVEPSARRRSRLAPARRLTRRRAPGLLAADAPVRGKPKRGRGGRQRLLDWGSHGIAQGNREPRFNREHERIIPPHREADHAAAARRARSGRKELDRPCLRRSSAAASRPRASTCRYLPLPICPRDASPHSRGLLFLRREDSS